MSELLAALIAIFSALSIVYTLVTVIASTGLFIMKTKAQKHVEAGTLEQFRARQKASREGQWLEKRRRHIAQCAEIENVKRSENYARCPCCDEVLFCLKCGND